MDKPKKAKKPRGRAVLIPNKCIACGARCESACPADAVEMNEKGEPMIFMEKCIGCQKCVKVCPAQAIEMFYTEEEKRILKIMEEQKSAGAPQEEEADSEEARLAGMLAQYRGVWVFVESNDCVPARCLGSSWA
jgi:electron transfer flavoprotein alpha subunit